MHEIITDTEIMRNQASQMIIIQNQLNDTRDNLAEVRKTLMQRHTVFGGIGAIILFLMDKQILDEAKKMDNLEEAIQHIINFYESAEKVAQTYSTSPVGSSHNVARDMERQYDLILQEQAFALLKDPLFSKDRWRNASLDEREQILREFVNRLNAVMGVNVTVVNFKAMDGKDSLTTGYYNNLTKSVTINTNYMAGAGSYDIMNTVIHDATCLSACSYKESRLIQREQRDY